MHSSDSEAFDRLMRDLCLAFDKPHTADLVRVFAEALKDVTFFEVKRMAEQHRKTGKKFPSPSVLRPERPAKPAAAPKPDPEMSSWAVAANKILLAVCYFDIRRGFKRIGVYPPAPERGYGLPLRLVPPTDDSLQRRLMDVKREYVQMAEQAERDGETWDPQEFNAMCRQGFEKLLGTTGVMA